MRSFDAVTSEMDDSDQSPGRKERKENILVCLQIVLRKEERMYSVYDEIQAAINSHSAYFLARAHTSCQELSATT